MNQRKRFTVAAVIGLAWSLLPLLVSRWVIRGMGDLFALIGNHLDLEPQLTAQIRDVLNQLKTASLGSPWLAALVLWASVAWLHWLVPGKKWAWTLIWLLLILPLTAVAFWLTDVNGIRMGTALEALIPMFSELL